MVKPGYRDSGTTFLSCTNCGFRGDTLLHISEYLTLRNTGPFQDGRDTGGQISDCFGWNLSAEHRKSRFTCPRCSNSKSDERQQLVLEISMNRLPYIMCIMLNRDCFHVNDEISYTQANSDEVFHLRGIIYGDGNHFVARLITRDGHIWYHAGMTTRSLCIFEGKIDQIPDREWLATTSKGFHCRKVILTVYARD